MATSTSADPLAATWRRPPPDRPGFRTDLVIALVLLVGTAVSVLLHAAMDLYPEPAQWWVSAFYVLASTLPLAARRRWPEAVAVVIAAVFAASQLLRVPELFFANITLFLALYSVGAWSRERRRAHVVRALIVAAMFAWVFIDLVVRAADPEALPGFSREGTLSPFVAFGLISVLTNVLYFAAAWYFGDRAWISARERAALEQRTAELAAERERTAGQAVALERLRIARELHDVVAHHVSVMGVQAGAARRVLSTRPEQAVESLAAIEASARDAVDELHRMLTTLRDDAAPGDAPADASTSPSTSGVERLPELVAHATDAGFPAQFVVVGEARPLPGTVSVSLHRIAQEAVTNTIKHAGAGAAIDLRLRYLADAVELEVADSGSRATASSNGSGLGHVGMRERMSAVGGHIEIGPRPRGGYLVRATVPTGPSA